MNAGPITPAHGPWIVEFTSFRVRNEKQRQAIESLSGPVLDEVLKIWLRVAAPGAYVVERPGTPIRTARFPRRSDARKFVAIWGGQIVMSPRR
jgi:hypothetical protein